MFYHLDIALVAWHTIDATRVSWARNFQVAAPHELTGLFWREQIALQICRAPFSTRPALKIRLKDQPYHRGNGQCDNNPTQGGKYLSNQGHPPTTRGTRTICSAVRSNCSMRSAGFPGLMRKAVAPFARSCAKMRSASRMAAAVSWSPVTTF